MKIIPGNLAAAFFLLIASVSAFGQNPPGFQEPLSDNDNQRYLQLRKRLPTVEIDGTIVTHGEVEDRMRTMRRSDVFSPRRQYEDIKPAAFRKMARDQVIDEVIALQEAKKHGIGLATGEAEAAADRFLPNDPEEAHVKMEQHGILDRDMLLDRSARNTLIDKLMTQIAADFPEPTTEEMRAFYQANSRVFEVTPESVLARKITIVKPADVKSGPEYDQLIERVDRLIERLKDGEDFAELADRNTEDPAGIGKGGSLGWVTRGENSTDFEKVLFNQKVGVIPDEGFRTARGFNILFIEEKKPPVLQPFEEAIPRIERGIAIERFKGWLAEKRKNASIVYYEELPMRDVLSGGYPEKTDLPF